jgi:hypothetical protein
MNTAETAKKALEILDSDGWCQGSTKIVPNSIALKVAKANGKEYRIGSHCLAGAWNKALTGYCLFLPEDGAYTPLAELIREQYPDVKTLLNALDSVCVVAFNDMKDITEADVRTILEKLTIGT